jgi:3-methylcrotonyl-CoA carboxylase alpha subunit
MALRNLRSVLVANRGEIAVRVFRTAKRLGMRTIAVYSQADRDAMFVREADEAHCIGPAPASESYLRIDAIVEAAEKSGADCIHPGYGFLSERAEFADACAANGIAFVGPPASAIRAMGLKDAAKALAEKAGAPVVPGYHGARQEAEFLRREAQKIGWPVLIKAVAGGGGKGMRRVDRAEDFEAALASASREAQGAFGDQRVLIEKYISAPRHIEIQIFADSYDHVVSLFERDCSLQRRHQKVIEEAPAPGLPGDMRDALGRAAVAIAKSVGYVGVGTVEFIADSSEGLRPDRVWFMEMNTRLQVEHPVTEGITGLDLVEWQFRVASGEPLPVTQEELAVRGHAVEARLYAEDPAHDFLPSIGKLWALRLPQGEGVRVDTGVTEGDAITQFYDPMIAKIIAHGATRGEALDRLAAALGRTLVAGPKSNVAFLKALCEAKGFRDEAFDTGFIERNHATLTGQARGRDDAAIRAGVKALLRRARVLPPLRGQDKHQSVCRGVSAKPTDEGVVRLATPHPSSLRDATFPRKGGRDAAIKNSRSPWDAHDAFQLAGPRIQTITALVDGNRVEAVLQWPGPRVLLDERDGADEDVAIVPAGDAFIVVRDGRQIWLREADPFGADSGASEANGLVRSPMHGRLIALFVRNGERVTKGQRLAIVEAMKMEHALLAPRAGEVSELNVEVGAQLAEGARLMAVA